jgi:hypothetical protein
MGARVLRKAALICALIGSIFNLYAAQQDQAKKT